MTKRLIRGEIRDSIPFFRAIVKKDDAIVLQEDGDLFLTADTGFSGTIALPDQLLEEIGVTLINFGNFRLANGKNVELPVFWGKVRIRDKEFETWFIPGDLLLGMEFFSLLGSFLSLDLEKGYIELIGENG